MEKATLTSKGQVTIPKNIRKFLDLHAGGKVEFAFNDRNEVILKTVTKKVDEVFGMLYQPERKPSTVADMDARIREKLRESFR